MDNELLREIIYICRFTGNLNTVSDLLTKPANCGSVRFGELTNRLRCNNDNKLCDAEPFMLIPCPEKEETI